MKKLLEHQVYWLVSQKYCNLNILSLSFYWCALRLSGIERDWVRNYGISFAFAQTISKLDICIESYIYVILNIIWDKYKHYFVKNLSERIVFNVFGEKIMIIWKCCNDPYLRYGPAFRIVWGTVRRRRYHRHTNFTSFLQFPTTQKVILLKHYFVKMLCGYFFHSPGRFYFKILIWDFS